MNAHKQLTSPEQTQIAAHAVCSQLTVKRCYAGAPCTSTTYERIRRAAADLNLPPPPPKTGAVA